MKKITPAVLIFIPLILLFLLSACGQRNEDELLTFDSSASYEGVLVSEASSFVNTSGYEEVFVSGEEKAEELIDLLRGQDMVEVSTDDVQQKAAELEKPGSYWMMLYNQPRANSSNASNEEVNPIIFYADGTIQVTQNGRTYFATDFSKELLRQLKSDWHINF